MMHTLSLGSVRELLNYTALQHVLRYPRAALSTGTGAGTDGGGGGGGDDVAAVDIYEASAAQLRDVAAADAESLQLSGAQLDFLAAAAAGSDADVADASPFGFAAPRFQIPDAAIFGAKVKQKQKKGGGVLFFF